ncbi:MAG: protein kinase domain-containing protein [Pyrinomonadaceae bacterium]
MDFKGLIGQVLDDKYRIERELGRGGMGSVYLATHVGTERPVAVKVIAPQFMSRPEFIERFRREARAAGRLRHPNVVNVTDFGFAPTSQGQVAYLVMEYLDGCSLGEILEEEKNLPLGWTLDIIEQVCSAVQEAHKQGIIHRDLKPDNIWLEPNQRGGYTVKVLDFGIAKLEESIAAQNGDPAADFADLQGAHARPTFVKRSNETTLADAASDTFAGDAATVAFRSEPAAATALEAKTVVQAPPNGDETKTALIERPQPTDDDAGAQTGLGSAASDRVQFSASLGGHSPAAPQTGTTDDLTRVGAVLGTPLYMSPEQCRGERLDARSDIYSLGVIAYQMLSGRTPFSGEFTAVMEAHKHLPPPPLHVKKLRRAVKTVIHSALAKDPNLRPQSAEAFASELRSQSEGLWMLLRRSLVIFSEHLPKFIGLTTLLSIPVILLTATLILVSFLRVSEVISDAAAAILTAIVSLLWSAMIAFCAYLTVGTVSWIVTQHLAVPLRPINVREALKETRSRWKAFAGTGSLTTLLPFVMSGAIGIAVTIGIGLVAYAGYNLAGGPTGAYFVGTFLIAIVAAIVAFFIVHVVWTLAAPVVMMEQLSGFKALKRSQQLVRRSLRTAFGSFVVMFLIPVIISSLLSLFVNAAFKAYSDAPPAIEVTDTPADTPEQQAVKPENDGVSFRWGAGQRLKISDSRSKGDMQSRLVATASESLIQILWLPMHIFISAFTAIIIALLFLKTRQAGGEPMHELLSKFEDSDKPRKRWQQRVRQRLIQSGRVTSRPTPDA